MTSTADFSESWHLLTSQDLAAVIHCCERLKPHAETLCGILQQMAIEECEHRDSLKTVAMLPLSSFNMREISQAYQGALGLRTALVHSNTAQEWADLLMQSVSSEMASRCLTAHRTAMEMMAEEN